MTTTARHPARAANAPALLLRALAVALLVAAAGSRAGAATVSISSIQPVADEASLSAAVVQFSRDTSSGNLVVYFTLSGAAATTNSPTLPTFKATSSAAFSLPPYATSGTITIADGNTSAQLVITPLDNSAITGDLPLVVTVAADPAKFYTVVNTASTAQIDIAEGDYQASVVVPAPVAYENTALVGTANDPNAPRRGILRVAFAPIATFPGSATAPGLTQFFLAAPHGAPTPVNGTALTISPTALSISGSFTANATAAFGSSGSFISFTPGITVGIPLGATVSAGGFSGTISLAAPTLPTYDKALKVQFGGTAPLPTTATGATGGTGTDAYYVTYKIGGSALASATNLVDNGVGWNVVAYPGSVAIPGTTTVNLGLGNAIAFPTPPAPAPQVIIDGHTYTLAVPFAGAPGPMTLTTGLVTPVHDGDAVALVGLGSYIGEVSAPIEPGTTTLTIENGTGSFALGDVFTLQGEVAASCRYVILSDAPGAIPGTQVITFRRFTAGTVGFDGVNNLHSALIPNTTPSPVLFTALNVSDDAPFSGSMNLSATGGIVQLLVPAESTLVDFGINPIDNGAALGRLSVTMALFNDLNYATVTPTSGQVIIAEADSTASITAAGNAVQGATPATTTTGSFVIALTNPFSQPITVPFTITGSGPGVGQPGIDYTLSSPNSLAFDLGIYSVVIPANATSATISVATLPTAALGLNGKTVTLTLSQTYDYLLAAASGSLNASATVSLLPPPPPVPQLSVAWTRDAQQPAVFGTFHTTGLFTISAQVAPVSDLTVQYALSGTAAPGTDYLPPGGYQVVSGGGVATILAGTTSVAVVIDPNINPLPPYKADDISTITLLPAGGYILTSAATSSATLTIDQGQIQVDEVTSETANGTYHQGAAIVIDVTFSAPVAVLSGTPTLLLNTGATNAVATYIVPSGSPPPTSTLRFSYVVGNGDVNPRLDYRSGAALVATPGTIVDANLGATHSPLFTVGTALPAPATTGSLFSNSDLVIDGTPAVALDPTAHLAPSEVGPAAGHFTVTCSPAPAANLTVFYTLGGSAVPGVDIVPPGGVAGQLVIPSGASSAQLVITPLDNAAVNISETVVLTLVAGSGYHLVTPATPTAAASDSLTVAQDRIGVLSVTAQTANGTYHIGDAITLAVNFSAAVTVSGTPQLALNTGATNALAGYASGSGSTTLLFTYVVGVGDASAARDYLASTALSGTLTAATGTLPVQLTLAAPGTAGSISAGSTLVIDGSPAIALDPAQHLDTTTVGASPLPGRFVVTCSPAPTSDLTVTYTLGGSAAVGTVIVAPANFTVGTASGRLTIPANSTSAILVITPESMQTLSASATVVMTLVAAAGYHLAGAPAVTSDTVTVAQNSIVITGVTALPTSGTFHLGAQLTLLVGFSAPVTVTGAPTLALGTGAVSASATLATASGASSSIIDFTYVVGAGDASAHLDYLSAVALALNGGSFTDASGNSLPVSTALPAPGSPGSLSANTSLVIDGSVPVVTAVSATSPDGTYTFSQALTLTVTFSLPVNVSGTPTLQLATGTTPAEATYAGGNGTAILSFTYVVGANDASADLDCTGANALALNGGSISWAGPGMVAAALALPLPGAAGSLGANKALVINGTLPTGKPPVGSISGPDAGSGGGCGLGSGIAGLSAALALCLRATTLRRHRRSRR